jgi:hypothetical protein
MISKENFFKFLTEFKTFEKAVDRMEVAISGSKYGCNLWESDWYSAVGKMFDIFVDTHFTEQGADWVSYYMFEDIEDKLVTVKQERDIFGEEKEIKYHLNSLEELWDFLLTDKKAYFKNV